MSDWYSAEPERDRQGLFGFFGGEDTGPAISDSLGVIGEILMRAGSGQGGAGVGALVGGLNERSSKRQAASRQRRMANRLADKIELTNPDLAAMIRADPQFGMELMGKRALQEDSDKSALALQKEKYALDLANQLEVLQKQRDLNTAAWGNILGPRGGGTTPTPAATAPPEMSADLGEINAPQQDFGTLALPPEQSVMEEPTGMGEIPPDMQPPAPEPAAVTAPQQQPPVGELDPNQVVKTMLSQNQEDAALQIEWTNRFQAPVPPSAVTSIKAIMATEGPEKAIPIFNAIQENWERQKQFIIGQQNTVQNAKDAEARALQEKLELPGMREDQFRETLAPVTGQRGPINTAQLDPAGPDTMAILKSQGFGLDDQRAMADPEAEAAGVMAGVRTAEGPGSAVQQTATRLTKRREDIETEADVAANKSSFQKSVDTMMKSIPDNLPNGAQMKAALAATVTGKDPAEQLQKWMDNYRLTIEGDAQMKNAADRLVIDQERLKIDQAKAVGAEETAQAARRAKRDNALQSAFTSQDTIREVVRVLYDPSENSAKTGLMGAAAGEIPGTARNYIDGLIETIDAHVAEGKLATMKGETATGASGLGSLTAPELIMLKSDLANVKSAINRGGVGLERALKLLYNHWGNVIEPMGGTRIDQDAEGFQERPFDLRQDNPALYQRMKEEGHLEGDERAPRKRPKVIVEEE